MQVLVALACGRFGQLDVLISNAGIGPISLLEDLRVDDWVEMVDVNLMGFLYGIAAALPVFREQGSGHFVNIVSTAGIRIVPLQAVCINSRRVRYSEYEDHQHRRTPCHNRDCHGLENSTIGQEGTSSFDRGKIGRRLQDLGKGRLTLMDESGIDVQVLSVTTPALHNLESEESVRLAIKTNDLIAATVAEHPTRFQVSPFLRCPPQRKQS